MGAAPSLPTSGAANGLSADGHAAAGASPPAMADDENLSNRQVLPYVALAAAASVLLHTLAGLTLSAPWIVPDELIYSELAKSLADGSLPAIRGDVTFDYGLVQPVVLAPAWALFDNPADAYAAAKLIAATVMSLVAFPAFFLARRFVSAGSAAVVAVFSVFAPSMLLSGTLLIEPVLYPVFVTALLAMVMGLQAPTRRNQLLVVAAILLACLTKPLSVVLAPAYVLAVVQLALLDRRRGTPFRAGLRAHSTAFVAFVSLSVLAVVGPALLGDPGAALGIYEVVLRNVDPAGTIVWSVRHLAGIDLYLAMLPFAATLILVVTSLRHRGDRRVDELAALALWTVGGTVAVVGAYASRPLAGAVGFLPSEARLHGRNVFVLIPILLIGLALYFERERPGPKWLRWGATVVAIVLPVSLPLARLAENANFQAFVVIPWSVGGFAAYWPLTLLPLAATVCWVTASSDTKVGRRSWVVVAIAFLCTTVAAYESLSYPNSGGRSTAGIGYDRRWIDHAVPPGAEVLALWVPPARAVALGNDYRVIWMSEFFNRAVGTVVETGTPMPYNLPHVEGSIGDGVLRGAGGRPIAVRFVLAPCRIVVAGRVVASDRRVDALIYRVPAGPIRVVPRRSHDPRCGPSV